MAVKTDFALGGQAEISAFPCLSVRRNRSNHRWTSAKASSASYACEANRSPNDIRH
jgi:hypothetical protein